MYYLDESTKISMKRSLDKLRGLVYPDEAITAVAYPNGTDYSPLNYNGNLIYLTINGLYENLSTFSGSAITNIDAYNSGSGYIKITKL